MKIQLLNKKPHNVSVALITITHDDFPAENKFYYHEFRNHRLYPSKYLSSVAKGITNIMTSITKSYNRDRQLRLHFLSKPHGSYVFILPFISSTSSNDNFEELQRIQKKSPFKYQELSDKQLKRCLRQSNGKISINPEKFTHKFYIKYGISLSRFQLNFLIQEIQKNYKEIKLDLPVFIGSNYLGKDILGREIAVTNIEQVIIVGSLDLLRYFPLNGILITDKPDEIEFSHKMYNLDEVGINVLQMYVNNNAILIDFLKAITPLHNSKRLVEIVERTIDHIYTTTDPEMFFGLTMENLFIEDEYYLMQGISFKQDVEKLRQTLQHVFSLECFNSSNMNILTEPGLRVLNVRGLDIIHQTAIALFFGILKKYNKFDGQFITDVFDHMYNPSTDFQHLPQILKSSNLREYIIILSKITKKTMYQIPKDLILVDTRKVSLGNKLSRMFDVDKWIDLTKNSLILQHSYQGTTLLDPESYPKQKMSVEDSTDMYLELYPPKEIEGASEEKEKEEDKQDYGEEEFDEAEDFKKHIPQFYLIPILVSLLDIGKQSTQQEIELEIISDVQIDEFLKHLLKMDYVVKNEKTATFQLNATGRSRIYDLQKVVRKVELETEGDSISAFVKIQKEILLVKDREKVDMLLKMLYVKARKMELILMGDTDFPKSQPVSSRVLGVYADFLEGEELETLKKYVKSITVLVDDLSKTEDDFEETHDRLDIADLEGEDVDFEEVVDDVISLSENQREEIVNSVMNEEITLPSTEKFEVIQFEDLGTFIPSNSFGELLGTEVNHPLADTISQLSLQDIFLHFLLNQQDKLDEIKVDFLLRRHKLNDSYLFHLMELDIIDKNYTLLISPNNYPLVPTADTNRDKINFQQFPEEFTANFLQKQTNRQLLISMLNKIELQEHVFLIHSIQAVLVQRNLRENEIEYVNLVLQDVLNTGSKGMKPNPVRNDSRKTTSDSKKLLNERTRSAPPPKPKVRLEKQNDEDDTKSVFTINKSQIPENKSTKSGYTNKTDNKNAYFTPEHVDKLEHHLLDLITENPRKIMVEFFRYILDYEGIENDVTNLKELLEIFSEVGTKSSTNIIQFTSNLSEIVKSFESMPEEKEFVNRQLISKIIERMRTFSATDEFSVLLKEYLKNNNYNI